MEQAARLAPSAERSVRAVEDERLLARIRKLHAANYYAYGYRRMWNALGRTGEDVGRDRVKRLMRCEGIQGAKRRGSAGPRGPPAPGSGAAQLRRCGA